MIDYYKIIDKYITNEFTKNIYITHVSLVTKKALEIAKRLKSSKDSLQFIEEAAMLHDIGIVKVADEEIGCSGNLEYICHGHEGLKILETEGLPKHAKICENHTGVGITKDEIIERDLPIPHRDMLPQTTESKIISYADLFFSKNPSRLFEEKSIKNIENSLKRFGQTKIEIFRDWRSEFT